MPIHDWTRVNAWIFNHFHLEWIGDLSRRLNSGLLPPDYYALAEQIAGDFGPDVLTLQRPKEGADAPRLARAGSATLAVPAPKVRVHLKAEPDLYAAKAKTVVIRHSSDHRVVAMIEIVSPGNKNNRHGLRAFVAKALEALRTGIHLLIIDLFPPGPRDPQGVHKAIWDELIENDFTLPEEAPLALAAYFAGQYPEAFIELAAVGQALPAMPLFLSPEQYVSVPLEETYQSAWEAVPAYWRAEIER